MVVAIYSILGIFSEICLRWKSSTFTSSLQVVVVADSSLSFSIGISSYKSYISLQKLTKVCILNSFSKLLLLLKYI
ncbi:17565_t:CDS:2 [Funneliformis geosporum]|uniref:17565_t:CDS:1 n=1 Tax=Funneliformis geosporum TaxID=1117311 RepID=A0A9W4STU7_9GLOM|nr:17565_t:CDS:2 [Funneliformis geosporum]